MNRHEVSPKIVGEKAVGHHQIRYHQINNWSMGASKI
jgi:hypothetical protein